MRVEERIVVDTNALISRLLFPDGSPGKAVRHVIDNGRLLISEPLVSELADVLARPKFDRYITVEDRRKFLRRTVSTAVPIRS
jgi:putative PIN family toxin of toxin-antitoxin system